MSTDLKLKELMYAAFSNKQALAGAAAEFARHNRRWDNKLLCDVIDGVNTSLAGEGYDIEVMPLAGHVSYGYIGAKSSDETVINPFPPMALRIKHAGLEIKPSLSVSAKSFPQGLEVRLGNYWDACAFHEGGDNKDAILQLTRTIMLEHESARQFAVSINNPKPS